MRTAIALGVVVLACLFSISQSAACCGDSRCDWPAEDCRSCPTDCGACPNCNLCGNRVCDAASGETPCNCPLDCGPCCPDGVCREDRNETAANCPSDCALTIRLLVIDEDTGAHLPGASVRCTYVTATYGPVLTNSEGRTSFSGVAGGDYLCTGELFAYLPGYVKFTVYPLSTPQEYVIPLKQNPACIEGTVYDAVTLEPLDNATVFCQKSDGTFVTRTVTASVMGYFYFEPVPPGSYRCYAERINYTPNSNAGHVDAGKMVTIDIYLNPRPGGIIGTVYSIVDNSTISGATVVCTAESAQSLATQTTNNVGFYHIADVYATKVTCTASAPDYGNDIRVGTVVNGRNTTINFWLGELPGSLQVTVVENGTTIVIPNATVVCAARSAVTPASGTVLFNPVNPGTYVCSAVADGYAPNSVSGNRVVRNRRTDVVIPLQPLPGDLTIITIDNSTGLLLPGASVSLTGPQTGSGLTGGDARIHFTVVAGTYSATATASGYLPGSNNSFVVTRGGSHIIYIRLNPLAGRLIVTVSASDTNAPLPGATIVVRGPTSQIVDTTTAPAPDARVEYQLYVYGIYSASASANGYYPGSKIATEALTRNNTVIINIILDPAPNTVRVTVLNIRDNSPITTARVTLTPGNIAQAVDSNARTVFTPLGAGTYTATATAEGFGTNSSTTRPLTRNETVDLVIYLGELTCTVYVQVINIQTGALIPNPNIALNNPQFTSTNNPTSFVIRAQEANSATASATGYRGNDTQSFTCTPGGTQNVTLRLNPVIQVFVSPRNVYDPSNPRLPSATVTADGVEVTTRDPTTPGRWVIEVTTGLPVTIVLGATAPGFEGPPPGPRQFVTPGEDLDISLAPVDFTFFFAPYEAFNDGTNVFTNSDSYGNNFFDFPEAGNRNDYGYIPARLTAGGSFSQWRNGTSPSSSQVTIHSYNSDLPLEEQTDYNYLLVEFLKGSNITAADELEGYSIRAAQFVSNAPSAQSPFYLETTTNLASLAPNLGTNYLNSLLAYVPEYTETSARNILFPVPYRINGGFINIRVQPFETDGTTASTFDANHLLTVTVNAVSSEKYDTFTSGTLNGKRFALFEFSYNFGDVVRSMRAGLQTEYFDIPRGGWVTPTGVNATEPSSIPGVTSFSFPPQQFLDDLFDPDTAFPGRLRRNRNARLFVLREYRVVKRPPRVKKVVEDSIKF